MECEGESSADDMHFDDVFYASDSDQEEHSDICRASRRSAGWAAPDVEDVAFEEDAEGEFSVSFQEASAVPEQGKKRQRVGLGDFEVLRLVGRGAYGKVHLVKKVERSSDGQSDAAEALQEKAHPHGQIVSHSQTQEKSPRSSGRNREASERGKEGESTGEIDGKEAGQDSVMAMKVLRKEFLVETNNVSYTMTERNILRNIHHPFIASLHYAFQTHGKVYLVMDFLPGGQLLWHMREAAIFAEEVARFYAAQLVLALEYLHSLHIIHRDIKPENILLAADGSLCLTDFGLAKVEVREERARTFCGTEEYMAPEIIKGEGHGKGVDWWSLGVLVYDMLAGETPFRHKQKSKLQDLIVKGRFKMPPYFSPAAHSLIRGLLQTDPAKRLGADGVDDIKGHRFFKGLHWDAVLEKRATPPIQPSLKDSLDTSYFDKKYTKVQPGDSPTDDSRLSESQDRCFLGFSYVRSYEDPRPQPGQ